MKTTILEPATIQGGPKAPSHKDRSDAGEGTADPAFAMLLSAMCAVQPRGNPAETETVASGPAAQIAGPADSSDAPPDTSIKDDAGEERPSSAAPMPAAQSAADAVITAAVSETAAAAPQTTVPAQTVEQQGPGSARILPAVPRPEKGGAGEKTIAQIPPATAEAGKEDEPSALIPGQHKTEQRAPGKAVKMPGRGPDAANGADGPDDGGDRSPKGLPSARGEAPNGAVSPADPPEAEGIRHWAKSADLPQKEAPVDSVQARADGTAAHQQGPAGSGHQTTIAPAAPGADKAAVEAAARPREAYPAELFDRTVSVIRDGHRLSVRIEPDGLGKIDIDLSLNNGAVNARINVADESTKSLIETNTQSILDGLLKEGLSVGGFSVSLHQNRTGDGADGAGQDRMQESKEQSPPPHEAERAALRGLVNIFV